MNYYIPDFLKRKPRVRVGRELLTALAMILAIVLWVVFIAVV